MSDAPVAPPPAADPALAPPVVSPTVAEMLAASGGRLVRNDLGRWSYPGALLSVAAIHVLEAVWSGTAFVAQTDHDGRPMAVTATPGRAVSFAEAGTPAAGTESGDA